MADLYQFKSSLIDYTYEVQGYSYTITPNDWTTIDIDLIVFGQLVSLISDVYSGSIFAINKQELFDKFEIKLSEIDHGPSTSVSFITTLNTVSENDTTSAVAPSVIHELDLAKADLASPIFSGTPTAPTADTGTSTTQIASTAFVQQEISQITPAIIDAEESGAAATALTDAKNYADGLLVNLCPLVDGKVPSVNLPSYVDDALEFANLAAFPVTGESGIIYLAIDTNLIYRWTGSIYVLIGDGTSVDVVAAGSDAFPRYDQAQTLTDPQKAQILTNIGAKKSYNLINKTASYALQLADFKDAVDLYDKVYLRMNLTAIGDVTIGTALTSLPNLTEISVRDLGTARATLVESGTVLNGIKTFTVQNEVKTLVKVGANEWDIIGALT